MGLLNKVMKCFSMFLSNNAPESQNFAGGVAAASSFDHAKGAKVAAIAAAMYHHNLEKNDVRAKVAAIAAAMHHHDLEKNDARAKVAAISAALHHYEMENSQSGDSSGIAAVVAAIHHHNNLKK